MNLHCLEVSEGSSCPHRSQSRQGFLVLVSVDRSEGGGIATQGEARGEKHLRSKVLMDCSLVPLETFDPGLSEIPLLPVSHETKRQPCFSNFFAWTLTQAVYRRFLAGPAVLVLSTSPKPPDC